MPMKFSFLKAAGLSNPEPTKVSFCPILPMPGSSTLNSKDPLPCLSNELNALQSVPQKCVLGSAQYILQYLLSRLILTGIGMVRCHRHVVAAGIDWLAGSDTVAGDNVWLLNNELALTHQIQLLNLMLAQK